MRILALIFSFVFIGRLAFAEDQTITTAELARHLGISTWRVPKEKLPASYKVTLQGVQKGKLAREYLTGDFKNTGDLLICARWLSDSVSISIDDGTTIISTKAVLPWKPVFTIGNKFKEPGAPLLICSVDPEGAKVMERHKPVAEPATTRDYSHTENGLAIVITALNP